MTASADPQIGNFAALGWLNHSGLCTACEQVGINVVGIVKPAFAVAADAHGVVTMPVNNAAVLAWADMEDIDITRVQLGEGKRFDFCDGVVAVIAHYIIENHHAIGIGVGAGVEG